MIARQGGYARASPFARRSLTLAYDARTKATIRPTNPTQPGTGPDPPSTPRSARVLTSPLINAAALTSHLVVLSIVFALGD